MNRHFDLHEMVKGGDQSLDTLLELAEIHKNEKGCTLHRGASAPRLTFGRALNGST